MCGYCKAAITFIKYMPQVFLNYRRKSTVGWSIENIILDFTGGACSFAQQFLDSWADGKSMIDTSGGFNIVKFLLSVFAMFFDIIFLLQHYVFYRSAWDGQQEIQNIEGDSFEKQKSLEKQNAAD
jgi:cystinosin